MTPPTTCLNKKAPWAFVIGGEPLKQYTHKRLKKATKTKIDIFFKNISHLSNWSNSTGLKLGKQ